MRPVIVSDRRDFTLANFAWVSRAGASLQFSASAVQAMDLRRRDFLAYLDREPRPWIYNVSGRLVDGAPLVLNCDERRAMAQRPISAGAVLDPGGSERQLPERIVRGMIFCRLTNCVEGHAGVRSVVAQAIADMLHAPLPMVPRVGHGAAGEMLLLSHAFGALIDSLPLEEKEASALVNGAPTAAALLADATLVSGSLLLAIIDAVAALIAAMGASLDAYDPALAELWGNAVAGKINAHLCAVVATSAVRGTPRPAGVQAPVSYRAAPRLLAHAVESLARLQHGAQRALRAVTDNPVLLEAPAGAMRALGHGGFFDADAAALFDQMAGEFADLARLLERMATRYVAAYSDAVATALQFRLRSLVSALAGYAEDAAACATRTGLPGSDGGGAPQNDLIAPVLQAWNKFAAVTQHVADAVSMVRVVITPDDSSAAAELRHAMCTALCVPQPLASFYG